ncbi:Uncharacterised protein [Pseudomonas fluorescens]|uniref:Uncharacterized protein n=1 Tax=Pseudomonas fluorescens TaxID=294 RepID=A0A3S4STZ7_PSEFL|nr:hypothetical protein [Pseudomonas fluorescens]VEF10831.1 Uncharacterised protein [Pseudomonas fluorescens]
MTVMTARLNYMRDTLLGPISNSAECRVVITPITPGAFQLQVLAPLPKDLEKAHSLTIYALGGHLVGRVAHKRTLDNGDLEIQIDV